jgi:hypothetical protein
VRQQASASSGAPRVSVIVPARNEEACVGECLRSLAAQEGVAHEVLLVDDGSTDRTAAIGGEIPGVAVIAAGDRPDGWSGKNHAAAVGAAHARGEWLLFTDADTVHAPGSLAAALTEAEAAGAGLLSYSPAQQLRGFWQHAVMPLVFGELEAAFDPATVSDDAAGDAAANGQYLLVRRDVYDAVGGHGSVAGVLLEDVAFAKKVKAAGYRLLFRQEPVAVSTWMYRDMDSFVEGWTRSLASLFPDCRRRAALRAAEGALLLAGPVAALALAAGGRRLAAGLVAAAVTAGAVPFFRRVRKARFPAGATAVSPLGLPLFAWLLLRSQDHHERGLVTWKGRTYAGATHPGRAAGTAAPTHSAA